jgi:gamma-D-glutamyl-L-lysine dipeptidyl-peptidase
MSRHRIRSAIAPVNREARVSSEQISQYPFGRTVTVLETAQPWVRVRGHDQYEGWVHTGYLGNLDALATDWGEPRLSIGCVVEIPSGDAFSLPLGAVIPAGWRLLAGEAVSALEQRRRFPPEPEALAASALTRFRGTAYLWGGVTPWGADCSGFTQSVFALHGVPLPRDSSQQAQVGLPAGDDPFAVAPADLLFFSDRDDGGITHVAIALEEHRMAHVSLGRGGHQVESLNADDPYVRTLLGHFRFARRIIGGF